MAAAGLSSHTLLDWIPHWDYPAVPAIAALVLAVAVGLVALFCRPDRLTWWGVFWAVIPDLDVV